MRKPRVLDLAEQSGWDVVIGLKQNQRDPFHSGLRLFARRPTDDCYAEQRSLSKAAVFASSCSNTIGGSRQ